jgi:hypothetical protein
VVTTYGYTFEAEPESASSQFSPQLFIQGFEKDQYGNLPIWQVRTLPS